MCRKIFGLFATIPVGRGLWTIQPAANSSGILLSKLVLLKNNTKHVQKVLIS
jgi:hypothetical protein